MVGALIGGHVYIYFVVVDLRYFWKMPSVLSSETMEVKRYVLDQSIPSIYFAYTYQKKIKRSSYDHFIVDC